ELTVLLNSASGRRAFSDGWRLSRHLFPSVFWNLTWHLAPEGLLSMLPHFELCPVRYQAQPFVRKQLQATLREEGEGKEVGVGEGDASCRADVRLWLVHEQRLLSPAEAEQINPFPLARAIAESEGWIDSYGFFRSTRPAEEPSPHAPSPHPPADVVETKMPSSGPSKDGSE
ncbi:MAG: hypothetical protein SGPRY_004530, partial [Prymnesium sp.]